MQVDAAASFNVSCVQVTVVVSPPALAIPKPVLAISDLMLDPCLHSLVVYGEPGSDDQEPGVRKTAERGVLLSL